MSFTRKTIANISKYRNAAAKVHKKEEWYLDASPASSSNDTTNGIKASCSFLAYRNQSGSVAILNVEQNTGKSSPVVLNASSSTVDLDFSPFHSHLLVTGGEDYIVKVWDVASKNRLCSLSGHTKRVDVVLMHPTADSVIASSSGNDIKMWDLMSQEEKIHLSARDTMCAMSWKDDGTLLATTSKDGLLNVWDPRASTAASMETACHAPNKSNRVLWLGDKSTILTTGFNNMRQREYAVFDIRGDFSKPIGRNQLSSSSGILMPLYDQDTGMIFLLAKGENTIRWFEVNDTPPPVFTDGLPVTHATPFSGACLLPKLALNVMEAEVARLLCLSGDAIVPVSYNVPRRTYRDFHDDLFPDTKGFEPALNSSAWFNHANNAVAKVSVDPAKRPRLGNQTVAKPPVADASLLEQPVKELSVAENPKELVTTPTINLNVDKHAPGSPTSNFAPEPQTPPPKNSDSQPASPTSPTRTSFKTFTAVRASSFRYISGKPLHVKNNFEDLRNVGQTLSGESNVLYANKTYLAFPTSGPGGRIVILPHKKPGRMPVTLPTLIAGSEIGDFAVSQFHDDVVVSGSEDGKGRVWKVPEGGLKSDMNTPASILSGHTNRVNLVQFHPFVSNLLATASPEQFGMGGQGPSVRLWDVATCQEAIKLEGFSDSVFSCAWSMDGQGTLATTSKDKLIRLFDARKKTKVAQWSSHEGTRACRAVWVGPDKLVTIGFSKSSHRELHVHDTRSYSSGPLHTLQLSPSPSVLVPHFDPDTNILYLSGRGDTTILPIEVSLSQTDILFPLPRYESHNGSVQLGVCFHPKTTLDVRNVEVAKCWRLTQSNIETISFSIPRNRKEYFQDDVFPETRDPFQATMTSEEWISGREERVPCPSIDLKPTDMQNLRDAPQEVKSPARTSHVGVAVVSEEEKKKQLFQAMFDRAKDEDDVLPQDQMEGVDEDEWDD